MAKYLVKESVLRALVKERLLLISIISDNGINLDEFYIDEYAIDKLIKEITKWIK